MYSILIADDEPLALRGNRIIIERSGLEVEKIYEAGDGAEAWELLEKYPVDLVITDIKMPKIDGVSLCRRISQEKKNIRTIIVSGYADFQYAREALRYGVKDYILKPVQRQELIQSVSSVLYEAGEQEPVYVSHREIEEVLTLLQQGIWLGRQEDLEQGIRMYEAIMEKVSEDYALSVSGDFCRMLAEKLSLKTGQLIDQKPLFPEKGDKKTIVNLTTDFVCGIQKELLLKKQTDYTDVLLGMAEQYLEENYARDITLADLASRTGFSTNYFSQIFKEKTGKTFVQCRTEYRIRKAKELLRWSGRSITDVAMEVGYNDSTYFIRVFKELVGQTPSSYKKGGECRRWQHGGYDE